MGARLSYVLPSPLKFGLRCRRLCRTVSGTVRPSWGCTGGASLPVSAVWLPSHRHRGPGADAAAVCPGLCRRSGYATDVVAKGLQASSSLTYRDSCTFVPFSPFSLFEKTCIYFFSQMIETLVTTEAQELLYQLTALLEQELRCQPKACGLRLIESAHDNGLRMTARLRDFEVKDLLSLTQFFGFHTETFSLAVNFLDRFLSKMKVSISPQSLASAHCSFILIVS